MIKGKWIFILLFSVLFNTLFAQAIFVGGNADINSCYLGGTEIKDFKYPLIKQIKHTYRPGFDLGFTSDFYPLKTKKQIFLISINAGYQQYSQAIEWSGDESNQYNYTFYESKVNRELYYELLAGVNIKGFVFKTGLDFMQTIASSGNVSVKENNVDYLNTGRLNWPSSLYKLSFGHEELLAVPIDISYSIHLADKIYIAPELQFDIGVVGFNYIDFGYYGNAWGGIIKGSIGLSLYYSVLKKGK
jgi:hypothetical protein